jgi:hypothetical protein
MQKFLLLLSFALLVSCQSNKKDDTNGQTTKSGSKYTTLPNDQYSNLFKKITNIDFIAYTTNLSMSFDEPNSVRTILQYISKEATTIPDHCEKTVRVTFIADGAIYTEADVYAYDGCSAFVFYENGEPTYANQIDPLGVEFFQRYIPKEGPEEVPVQ